MQPLARQLQSHSRGVLTSSRFAATASVRCIATQCIRNSSPEAARRSSAPLSQNRPSLSHNLPLRSSPAIPHYHPFSTSPLLSKYKGPKATPPAASTLPPDPYRADKVEPAFNQLDDEIRRALDRYSKTMTTLRSGGRINPLAIESLRAVVDKGSKETARVGDLAQVIPKGGRMLQVLVGEQEFIKPVSSAILSSELSLNPQPDPHNPLQLNVAIPPPTKESRDRSVTYAKSEHLRSSTAIKNARGEMKKLLKRMGRKGGSLQPDDIRALTKRLDAVVQKGNQDLDDVFENTKKALEQGQ